MAAKYKLGTFIRFSTSPEGAESDAPPQSGTINGVVQRANGYFYFVEGYNHSFAERHPNGRSEQGPQQEIPESKVIAAYREMPKKKGTRTRKSNTDKTAKPAPSTRAPNEQTGASAQQ